MKLIRAGACGSVYKINSKATHQQRAVKIVALSSKHNIANARAEFIAYQILKESLTHSCSTAFLRNVVCKVTPQNVELTMPLASCDGLRLLKQLPPSALEHASKAMTLFALGAMHDLQSIGIQHRDLKVNNVLCYRVPDLPPARHAVLWHTRVANAGLPSYVFKLVDFGAAAWHDPAQLKYFGPPQPCFEPNRRPLGRFTTFKHKQQTLICNAMRFGGVLPYASDAMAWFASLDVLTPCAWVASRLPVVQEIEQNEYSASIKTQLSKVEAGCLAMQKIVPAIFDRADNDFTDASFFTVVYGNLKKVNTKKIDNLAKMPEMRVLKVT